MNDKKQILKMLEEEFNRWEALLASLSEGQITDPQLPANLSIKDVVAHLWTWQQRSIARMEAAIRGTDPEFPGWPETFDPENEADTGSGQCLDLRDLIGINPGRAYMAIGELDFSTSFNWGRPFQKKICLIRGDMPGWTGSRSQLSCYLLTTIIIVEHLEPLLAWLRQKGICAAY